MSLQDDSSARPGNAVPRKRPRGPGFWLRIAVAAVAVGFLVIRGIRSYNSGGGEAVLLGGVIGLVIAAVIVFLFGISNARRIGRAESAFPSSMIVPVVVAPLLARQLAALMPALALAPSRVSPTKYATLVADARSVQFLTGSTTGDPAAAFPSDLVRNITLGSAQIGLRTLTSIDIAVAAAGGTLVLPVTPMRSRGNWLRAVPDADIARLADDLRRAVGASAQR